jgi:hypothetical protein
MIHRGTPEWFTELQLLKTVVIAEDSAVISLVESTGRESNLMLIS